ESPAGGTAPGRVGVVRRRGVRGGGRRRPGDGRPGPGLGSGHPPRRRRRRARGPGRRPHGGGRTASRTGRGTGRHPRRFLRRVPGAARRPSPSRRLPRRGVDRPGDRVEVLRHPLHRAVPPAFVARRRMTLADYLERRWRWRLEEFPEFAIHTGEGRPERAWTDWSFEGVERRQRAERDFLDEIDVIVGAGDDLNYRLAR